MSPRDISKVIRILKEESLRFKTPYVTEVSAGERKDPFLILVSCLISLRTKDGVTREASKRLFSMAPTPQRLSSLKEREIEKAIYPAGFYRVKARQLKAMARELISRYRGGVPDSIDELTTLKGVGRKTANLVVTMGFNKPGICVDTHVHRITNRWGYVKTNTPRLTESALREKLPKRYWIPFNDLLVTYGQNICTPVSPFCSRCRIYKYCERAGVKSRR